MKEVWRRIGVSLLCIFTMVSIVNLPIYAAEEDHILLQDSGVERESDFNDGWKFSLSDNATYSQSGFDDSSWRDLSLPHDWSIELDFNQYSPGLGEAGFLDGGTGWYRKDFVLPESMDDKSIRIYFGGVYMDSTVYVNGEMVGNYPNGYTPFSYDLTDYLICDGSTENVIAVKVVNQQPSSRWYSGSGIYRDVTLIVSEQIHVGVYGTHVTYPNIESEIEQGSVQVNIDTEVDNDSEVSTTVNVRQTILNEEKEAVTESVVSETQEIAGSTTQTFTQTLAVSNPTLWQIHDAHFYYVLSEVLVDGVVVDSYETRFGFSYFEATVNDGFFFNGEYIKLYGVCMHHDQGALGAVASYDAIYRQMQIMKDMGVNAIRVTHNPASDELLEICEDLGLLVIDEAFDTWYDGKKTYDYGRFFEQAATHPEAQSGQTWAEYDIKQMVERGKNSPAIIMWSIGNEVGATSSTKGVQTAQNLVDWIKEVDSVRYTTIGDDKFRFGNGEGVHEQVGDIVDVVGFNYAEDNYDALKEKHPDWIIYGSETSSATASRGDYAHADSVGSHDAAAHPDYTQSSYDNDHVGWGKTATNAWIPDRDREYILGQFIWTGFDYIGEATPWHNQWPPKSSYFGIVDTAGFAKDDYYLYQSQWLDVESDPMVHIMPHWNWEDDALLETLDTSDGKVPVRVYSNAASVELFLDDVSLGEQTFKKIENETGSWQVNPVDESKLYLEWRLEYVPGELKAIAKNESGDIIASDIVKSASTPSQIELQADKQVLIGDGYSLSYISVDINDSEGNLVPTANNLVQFSIEGNAEIVGVDNGRPVSHESYKGMTREAYNGKALVIVQAKEGEGEFSLTATSAGLTSDSVIGYTTSSEGSNDTVLGYDYKQSVVTNVGQQPKLPTTVSAILGDGSKVDKNVSWDSISQDQLLQATSFIVEGIVENTTTTLQIKVIVKGVIGVETQSIVSAVGVIPTQLPPQAKLIYSDASEEIVSVSWDREITAQDVAQAGIVEIEGTVSGHDEKAILQLVTSDEVSYSDVVSVRSGSDEYPKTFANYNEDTNSVVSHNMSNAINDGTAQFSPSWNNWQNAAASHEIGYVGIEFEEATQIGKATIHFFTDGHTKKPSELVIETSVDGVDFTPVENQSEIDLSNPDDTIANGHDVTFDAVQAKYVRLALTSRENKPVGISELYLYGPQVVANSEATLDDITINGTTIEGFDSQQTSYTYTLAYNETLPQVQASSANGANIFVIQAFDDESSAIIRVTSQDGSNSSIYTIQLQREAPTLSQVDVVVEQTSILQDTIIDLEVVASTQDGQVIDSDEIEVVYQVSGPAIVSDTQVWAYESGVISISATVTYKGDSVTSEVQTIDVQVQTPTSQITSYNMVEVTSDLGVAPVLPSEVLANYDNGFSRYVNVVWEDISEDKYGKYGNFNVIGNVQGQSAKVIAHVEINSIIAAQTISTTTPLLQVPDLVDVVDVYYANGTQQKAEVLWNVVNGEAVSALDASHFSNEEIVIVLGSIEGTDVKAKAQVRVSSDTSLGDNIARQWTGSELPAAFASFTNDGPDSNDRVTSLNDNIIHLSEGSNRWTNWQSSPRSGDYVGILFAEGGSISKKYVDNITLGLFEDSGTKVPANIEVQYYTGDEIPTLMSSAQRPHMETLGIDHVLNNDANWTTVTNVSDTHLTGAMMNEITFDRVHTYAIRVILTHQSGFSTAITELQIFEKEVTPHSSFETTISLDGLDMQFDENVYTYNIALDSEEIPTFTVDATNNAAVTVVSAIDAHGSSKIIVDGEDGKVSNQKVYTFNYSYEEKEQVQPVTFMPASGSYIDEVEVKLSSVTEEALIYYTTDGSEPSTSSTMYNGSFIIDANTTIKAIAVKEGMLDSEVQQATYTISHAVDAYQVEVIHGSGSNAYEEGALVEISAHEMDGKRFAYWSVLEGVVDLEDVRASSTSFIMPKSEVSIEAIYEVIQVNKDTLTAEIALANSVDMTTMDANDPNVIAFKSALNYAIEIMGMNSVTQQQIDQAGNALRSAREALQVHVVNTTTVKGTLVDQDGVMMPHTNIAIFSNPVYGVSNASGYFELANIPIGDHTFKVYDADGYVIGEHAFTITQSDIDKGFVELHIVVDVVKQSVSTTPETADTTNTIYSLLMLCVSGALIYLNTRKNKV